MSDLKPDSSATRRLLGQVASGDDSAFEAILSRYQRRLHRFVQSRLDRRVRTRVDASDLVQETGLQAFQRLDDYLRRKPMPFWLWLEKTAHERLRKARRRHLAPRAAPSSARCACPTAPAGFWPGKSGTGKTWPGTIQRKVCRGKK